MAIKTGKHTELVIAECSEEAQAKLIAAYHAKDAERLVIEKLKRRPEVIEGEFAK